MNSFVFKTGLQHLLFFLWIPDFWNAWRCVDLWSLKNWFQIWFLGERSPVPSVSYTLHLKNALKKCQIWDIWVYCWPLTYIRRSAVNVYEALCSSPSQNVQWFNRWFGFGAPIWVICYWSLDYYYFIQLHSYKQSASENCGIEQLLCICSRFSVYIWSSDA